MITVKNLDVGFLIRKQKKRLIQAVNMTITVGKFTAIIGRNGTGKTSLLRTLAGFIPPLNGAIFINNKALNTLSPIQRAKYLSIVSTERMQLSYFNVLDLISLGRYPHTNLWGTLSDKDEAVIRNVIELVQIQDLLHKSVAELSDGEHQKTMIARALVQDTPLILLDEPTAHLDWINRRRIFELLKKLAATTHKTILVATHELDLAQKFVDEIYLIKNKQVINSTSLNSLIDDFA